MIAVGMLGGTFDPIHAGHLDVAEVARQAIGLDQLLLVPANVPPHRPAPGASAAHRFAMAALATQDRPGLHVSDLEMRSNEPSYTSTTLDRLCASGLDALTVCFVIGADAFREIRTWKAFPGDSRPLPFRRRVPSRPRGTRTSSTRCRSSPGV